MTAKTILITGASGNLGRKLSQHLAGRYALRLLDRTARQPEVVTADLSVWEPGWVELFQGVDAVVHLAANPTAELPVGRPGRTEYRCPDQCLCRRRAKPV